MSKRAAADTSSTQPSSIAGEAPFLISASTPSDTPQRGSSLATHNSRRELHTDQKMDELQQEQAATSTAESHVQEPTPANTTPEEKTQDEAQKPKATKKKSHHHKASHKKLKAMKAKNKQTHHKDVNESDSDSSAGEDSASDDSDSESSSEDERAKRKAKKAKQSKKSTKNKKARKSKKHESDSSEDGTDSDSNSDASVGPTKRKKKATKKSKRAAESDDDSDSTSETPASATRSKKKTTKKVKKAVESSHDSDSVPSADDATSDDTDDLQAQIDALKLKQAEKKSKAKRRRSGAKCAKSKHKTSKKDGSPDYKRVDQLWDTTNHMYTLKESNEEDETEFSEYAFLVRRCFTWENKYTETVVDIKSKQLRAVLAEVMKDCKSVSLEAEEPTIDPNLLFLYLEELRKYYKKTLKSKIKAEKKRKVIKKLELQKTQCKTLVSYIDEDYAEIKKTLYPLLEAGNITFDLLWALFKPNETAITSCYGAWDEARCFRVEYANKYSTMQRGEWYCIEGKYMEFDGKNFGHGDFEVDVEAFKGPRKISSLATYPLRYHRDPDAIRKKIIERGEQFVGMEGMQYKFHKGLAFMKKKKQVLKININGRIMIDPATFRRINPNYPISLIKPKDSEELITDDEEDSDDCSCCDESDEEGVAGKAADDVKNDDHADDTPKYKYKWIKDDKGCPLYVAVEVDENGDPLHHQRVEGLDISGQSRKYTEDELLLTSPVVLGFAFSEKLWLEFSLSGVNEITYNEDAFDSLVLPDNQKDIVRALVESHKFNAAKTIDDVVQGKGKGLVSVLHGPPGTGKTLTAEGISELLKCPLYMVSAGELGTDPARLEHELQKILDIAHSWGAVLLLDEADVFLEKREVHDIHRNALVSIFLRLLEYFQGILFLTTNRVATFDEAFSSRIHLPLKYDHLTGKAKKAVWKQFIELVRKKDNTGVAEFTDPELDTLSRHQLNGRQIKNAVRTAQALALREQKLLGMEHVKKVLDVSEDFDRDLKGGTGYLDAMRSYT